MRILAIRGENLASLGRPFEIDFESGPLADAGLFAITGETGSGKSTILDALCLALYGVYPRFSENQQQDALPDPSGTRPSIMDGGTILRRGAGNGHAEVEFIGHDGQRYRARWEARRARNKPNGTIQSAQRTLGRIEGSAVHHIASSKTEVQRAIDSQTGLSFEQFCRTVLLPQGQFDAFLMAQKAERGALLEKITGTEIYGRISKIVYENTRRLKNEAEQLEARLTNLGVLPADQRAAIQQRVEDLERCVEAKTSEQNALRDRISRLDNVELNVSRLTEAEQTLEQAHNNSALAEADRAHLKALLLAEPLRSLRDHVTDLGRRHGLCEEEMTDARGALVQAIEDDNQAKAIVLEAQTTHEKAEQNFTNFGPIWEKAAFLDSKRATAESEANSARVADANARLDLSKCNEALTATAQQLRDAEVELETSRAELESRSECFSLADQIGNIEILFGRYQDGLNDAGLLRRQANACQKTANELSRTLADLNGKVATESKAQEAASETAHELQQQLDGIDENSWKSEESGLVALHRQTRDLQLLIERYLQSATKHTEAQANRRNAIDITEDASNRIAAAEVKQLDQIHRRKEIQHNSELVEASLEERSAHLRSLLVDGQPCPICGATEHPYTAPGTDDSLSRLADNLRRERSALDEQLKLTGLEIQHATAARTTAEGLSRNAERDEFQAARDMDAIASEFTTLRGNMEPACTRFGFTGFLPEALNNDSSASSLVVHLTVAIEALQITVSTQLSAISGLRCQVDNASKEMQLAQTRLNVAIKRRDEANQRLHETQIEHVRTSEGLKKSESRVGEIEQDLSFFIAGADISLDALRGNPSTCFETLKFLAQEVIELRAREAGLAAQVGGLFEKHKEQTTIRGNLVARARDAAENLENRNKALRLASDERALLLNGEETSAHRTRINVLHLHANNALQHAREDATRLAEKRAAAQQREISAAEALAKLQDEITSARTAYREECGSLGIEIAVADELLATAAAQVDELKMRIESIDRTVHDAEHTVNERRSVVQNLSSAETETADRATLDTTLSQITDEINRSREEIGEQKGRLTQDEGLRRTADDLRREADTKTAVLATWQQVEDAIGSANGDRFRTFAQSITLEQLVQLANEHLASFSGRYQLTRSADTELALHVIDFDMGEEHRSVRSLSGGERFLVSLSLALSLSGLEGHDFTVDTLFIDEGFGSLDADTLGIAITALETLHGRGRKVGVITHVAAMIDNIPVQVKVERLGAGSSVVRLQSAGSVA